MTKLYVDYCFTISEAVLNVAYALNEYKKEMRKLDDSPSKFNTMMKEDGFKIVKVVDHTDLYISKPKSGSLIEERYSAPKWETTFRRSVELDSTTDIYISDDEEVEEKERTKLPEIQKAYVISKKYQKKFTEKYPEEKYRLQENKGCVVINKPAYVDKVMLPKGWYTNPKYLKDLVMRGEDAAVPYHINNYNSKFIVYLDPEDYTIQYGSQIRTKTYHTDKVEKWVKYLLRHRGLKVIFRTPKGDMYYMTKGRHEFWDTLNTEFIEILEQLVMLQPVPKSVGNTAWVYNSMHKEHKHELRDYMVKLLKELKYYNSEMSFDDALELYVERHVAKYQDVNEDTVFDYSVYTNDFGFYIYENPGKGQTIESLVTNKYLELNGLLEERIDIDEAKVQLEQLKEDIKGIYPIAKDIGLELFEKYEQLEAKLSREYSIDESCGYAEWKGVDEDEDVEVTVLNHIENEEIAKYK